MVGTKNGAGISYDHSKFKGANRDIERSMVQCEK